MNKPTFYLKQSPLISFQLFGHGLHVQDELREENNGFYDYDNIESVELVYPWFPMASKWLRPITWVLNFGVPYFPDAESAKASKLLIKLKRGVVGMFLTDTEMVEQARIIQAEIEARLVRTQAA